MPLVSMRELLDHAAENGYGLPAFNVNNLEQVQAAVEAYPKIPLVMHQDHGQSPDVCKGAIDLGFTSVMMDGSLEADGKTIASYDYNVDVTKKVVDMAHKLGVT